MARLIYVANVTLDGYIEDAHGSFDFTAPSDEVFAFITELARAVDAFLYGRRLYETMSVWEAYPSLAAGSTLRADFANIRRTAHKIVDSTTMPRSRPPTRGSSAGSATAWCTSATAPTSGPEAAGVRSACPGLRGYGDALSTTGPDRSPGQ